MKFIEKVIKCIGTDEGCKFDIHERTLKFCWKHYEQLTNIEEKMG